tara:strand:- start:556626 stop:557537 length:912 start_codon:yes stop_codon:yes gene_type:complete
MSELIDFAELKASDLLPSPKGVRLNIMRLCQQESVSLQELAKQIQADPVLAGRIIKIGNVANPNRLRPIASVTTEVLILVGVFTVRQVVLGISLVASYQNGSCTLFNYAQFWSRSVALACAAQTLAGYVRVAPIAEMFTCGLLAGIGRLALASARPQAYSLLLEKADGFLPDELIQAEAQLFGFNHLSLGTAMMNDWNIPRLFTEAVLFHEAPALSGLTEGTRQQKLVRLLHIAARIADICVAPEIEREQLIADTIEYGSTLDITFSQMAAIINRTSEEWLEWADVLRVHAHPLPQLPEGDAD